MFGLRVGIDHILLGDSRGGTGGSWWWRWDFGGGGFAEVVENLVEGEQEKRGVSKVETRERRTKTRERTISP